MSVAIYIRLREKDAPRDPERCWASVGLVLHQCSRRWTQEVDLLNGKVHLCAQHAGMVTR